MKGSPGHIQIRDAPSPLSIQAQDPDASLSPNKEAVSSGNMHLSPFSLTSPDPQAPMPESAASVPGSPYSRGRRPGRRATLKRSLSRLGHNHLYSEAEDSVIKFWDRFTRKGKKNIGVLESLKVIATSSCTCSASRCNRLASLHADAAATTP